MYRYNYIDPRHRVLTGKMTEYVKLYKTVETFNLGLGGVQQMQDVVVWTGNAEKTLPKIQEIIDGNTGIPVKYIQNTRFRIPYLYDLNPSTNDYGLEDSQGIKYKINSIIDETGDKKILTLNCIRQ